MARIRSILPACCVAAGLSLATTSAGSAADVALKARPAPVAPVWQPSLTVYSLFDWITLHNVFPGRESKSDIYQSTNGFNYTLTPDWLVGAGFIYGHSNNELIYLGPGAESDSDGVTGFLTTAYTIPNLFTVGGAVGYGGSKTHQTRFVMGVLSTSDQDSKTWFVSGYVSKLLQYGNLYATPQVRVLYRENETDAYVESIGTPNPAEKSTLGQLAAGSQFSYAIPTSAGWTVYPTAELFYLYDFDLPLYQLDRDAFDLKAGLSATSGNWAMGAAFQTILGRDEYDKYYGVRAFLSYRFGGAPSATSGSPLGVTTGGAFGDPFIYGRPRPFN